jgi:hypothetical protein
VVQVIQAGYRLHDRLLRPAQVGVAKGGPATAPPSPADAEPEAGRRKPAPKPAPKAAGNDDDPPPGSTIDTSA